MEVQINQNEPEYLEIVFIGENCHFEVYFGLEEWENFKKTVNVFDLDWRTSKTVEAENAGIFDCIDMQMGDVATLHFNSKNVIETMIGFKNKLQWGKFKKQINSFQVSSVSVTEVS